MPRDTVKHERVRPLEIVLIGVLAVVALLATRDHREGDSPTIDETYHVYAGAEYLERGTYQLNLEHPPLMKLLAALALRPLRLEPPAGDPLSAGSPVNQADFYRWVYRNSAPAHRIVSFGRQPFAWLLVLLVLVVYAITRCAAGVTGGLLAAGLLALDPSFVAHAGVIHTDVGAALAITVTLAVALRAARRGSLPLWLATGVALGLALATKFTCVLLLPLVALAALNPRIAPDPGAGAPSLARNVAGSVAALAVGMTVLLSVYAVCLRSMPAEDASRRVGSFLASRQASPDAIRRFERLSSIAPSIGHYAAGVAGVVLYGDAAHPPSYLHGTVSATGFRSYFLVAFLVKSTPAFLVFTAAFLVLGRRALLSYWTLGPLAAAGLFLLAATRSSYNIGLRHILPIYPLLAVAGAVALARKLSPRHLAIVTGLLLCSAAASLRSIHPFELAYFNGFAGGPENGASWLADSNLDWGQDLKRLGEELRRRGVEARTTVLATSGLATNYYIPSCRVLSQGLDVTPGIYAVAANFERIGAPYVELVAGPAYVPAAERVLDALRARPSHRPRRLLDRALGAPAVTRGHADRPTGNGRPA